MASDNILVSNKGLHPTINFRFMLRVWGIFDVPCKSIRAFTKPNEYEFIQEGGLNDYVHIRRKPISQPFKLVVERYAGTDYIDPLPNGAELVLPVLLFIWNDRGSLASMFSFAGCVVMEKEYGELSAEKAGLFTETITIGYTSLTPINIPDGLNDSGGNAPWELTYDEKGKPLTKYANTRNVYHGDNWEESVIKAKWEYDKANPTGTTRANQNVKPYHDGDWTKTEHAAKWEYDKTLPTRVLRAHAYRARGLGINPNKAKWEFDPSDPTKTSRAMSIDVYHGKDWKETEYKAKWDPKKDGTNNVRAMSTGIFDYTAVEVDPKLKAKWEYKPGVVPQKNVRALSREIYHGAGWQKTENAAKWDPKNGTKNERAMSTGIFDYTAVEVDPALKAKWEYKAGVTPQPNVRALSREIYHGGGWSAADNAAKWEPKNGTKNERAMSTGMFDYNAVSTDPKLKEKWEYQAGVTPQKNVRALSREVYHGGGWSSADNASKWDASNGTKNERAMSTGMFDYNAKTDDPKLKAKWEYKSGKKPPENLRALTRKVDYGKNGGKAKSSIQAPLDHGNNNAVKTPRAQKRQIFHGNGWQAASFQGVWKYDKGNPSKGYRGMSAAFLSGGGK